MNNFFYKIKNRLFNFSIEAKKLRRPTYSELIKYQNFQRKDNNVLTLSFGSGRSGQNWFSKIFNSHPNWVGTCERFADYEAFYRYICYYNLPISKNGFIDLIELSSKRDMAKHQNSFISSPYFSFGIEELTNRLKPNSIFFNIRNPIKTVESLYNKGWYQNLNYQKEINSPLIDITDSQYRSFSRIIPKGEYLKEWLSLSRIGKITWFWSTVNKTIYDKFNNIQNIDKYYVKLEDVNQNYDIYEKLSKKFNFKNKMTERQFYKVLNKAPNNDTNLNHVYKNWNNVEKKEFENIINGIFPHFDNISTNI
ncbi:hypothetical protein [Candidatus Pelagibacter ubique]|uniref:hypothetical protein n=1 Tax=Pelagibacter ubique TaxID=198252 RepID=UPI0003D1BCE4